MYKIVFILIFLFSYTLSAQDDLLDNSDFDSFFQEETSVEEKPGEKSEKVSLIDEVISERGITFGADYYIAGGYSIGIENGDWLSGSEKDQSFVKSPIMEMSSKFSIDARLSEHLRFFQKWKVEFPGFDLEMIEFFGDSSIYDKIFVRFGRQNITWGESISYGFTNLPARVPDGMDAALNDTFSFKMSVPIGVGGITLLAHTREAFWEDPEKPSSNDIGYGGQLNHVINLDSFSLDLNSGVYYHKDLNPRGYISLSTTILSNIELYTEGLITKDADKYLFSGNLGLYSDLFNNHLGLGGEYLYNGENIELDTGKTYPLMKGHNLSLLMINRIPNIPVNITTYFKTNYLEGEFSSLLSPVLNWDLNSNVKLSLAVPFILGADNKGFDNPSDNPDPYNREGAVVLRLIFHGKI